MSMRSARRRARAGLVLALAALLAAGCASHATRSPSASASTAPGAVTPAAPPPIGDDVRNAYEAALTSLQAGDWDNAARALKAIVDQHPELPGPAVNLAIADVHLNRSDEARQVLESAVKVSPGFAPAQHQLGRVLAAAGRFQDADEAYARAIAADPNYALAYYDRGVLDELYLQRLPEALQNYEAYQRLLPQPDAQVARWIADLQRRTNAPVPAVQPGPAPASKGGSQQ